MVTSPCPGFIEASLSLKMEEQLPAVDIVKDKVQLVPCLEGVMETDQEWMFKVLQQNVSLRHNVFHLVPLHYRLLLQYLDGVVFASGLVFA